MQILLGSLDLTVAIEAGQAKRVMCRDGKEHIFVNIAVLENKEPREFYGKIQTHTVSCAPPREKRVEGVNYYMGNLVTHTPASAAPASATPTEQDINNAQSVDDLPF